MKSNNLARGSLVIYETKNGEPRYRAKWRYSSGQQCAPTIGPAWLVKKDGTWVPRPGRLQIGFYDEQAAYLRMAELIAERDRELEEKATRPALTFDELVSTWLDYLSHGGRAKPSTLKDYRILVSYPRSAIRGKRELKARIMYELAGKEVAAITTDDIASLLDRLVVQGLSPRNVNKHREALHSVFAFGMKPGSFKLPTNPVAGTENSAKTDPEPSTPSPYPNWQQSNKSHRLVSTGSAPPGSTVPPSSSNGDDSTNKTPRSSRSPPTPASDKASYAHSAGVTSTSTANDSPSNPPSPMVKCQPRKADVSAPFP